MAANWTTALERYFIALMLDQLRNGNRLGHSFNKHAWIDMLTMFNSRFGATYEMDVLKIHFSALWKQYNDIKELLNQSGFSWDNYKKMVVAEAHIWDAYIQAHPEAETFWNKSLINFNDLCLIFAYTKADGRFSLSSHDVALDDDIPGVNADICQNYVSQQGAKTTKSGIALTSGKPSKPDWRPSMDRFFIKILLDQLRKGNKRNKTFSIQAWKNMLMIFNEKFRTQYDQKNLRHQYKKLFKYYVDMRSLLEQNGVSWDEKQEMIVADDSTWEKYIKMHPDARSYRKKSLLNYHDLALLFESLSKNGHEGHVHQDKNSEDDIFEVGTGRWSSDVGLESCYCFSSSFWPMIFGTMAASVAYFLFQNEFYSMNGIHAGDGDGYSSGGSDDLVTCWTTAMDNYLTDLLLDQALRGNKISHEFIVQAWIEIVTTFNAKFGSHYPINVIKNRYEHLRTLYNGLSILLEQNGISWDDTQEMVTATDSVWDSCIKAYPYAQSYRNRSMPSYHKLSLIYGEESDCGGNNHLADLDNEDPSLMIGDIQFHANDDFPETYWTSSMDRYLIDLLLEQVRKGRRQDCNFKNDAWIDMALSFVGRFGLQYDQNILISHYKSLGKQYSDMKNLVGRKGFSWDDKRQMVAASDNAWNACIKEHPDAKPYRTELKLDYNDLCLIFGNPASNGRASQFGLDISCNGDGANCNHNDYCLSTDWTPPMDRYFIDLMLEKVRRESMVNKKFNKRAWVDMVAKFSVEFGIQYDKNFLKCRFMNLRNRFNDMKTLLNQNGFSWDEMQQMITADDNLWNAYVKRYPDARLYWNKTLPNYNDLFLIYGNGSSERCHDYSSYSMDLDSENYSRGVEFGRERDDESPASNNSCMDEMDGGIDNIFGDLVSPAREFEIPDQARKRKSESSTFANPRKVSRSYKYESQETYEQNALSMDGMEKENSSIEIVVDALQAIPGMDDELFLEACKLLVDERKVKKFVVMDLNQRMAWLLNRLHQ